MQAVSGTVKEGVIVPDTPLPEGTRVEIFFNVTLSPNALGHGLSDGPQPGLVSHVTPLEEPVVPPEESAAPAEPSELDTWYRALTPDWSSPGVPSHKSHSNGAAGNGSAGNGVNSNGAYGLGTNSLGASSNGHGAMANGAMHNGVGTVGSLRRAVISPPPSPHLGWQRLRSMQWLLFAGLMLCVASGSAYGWRLFWRHQHNGLIQQRVVKGQIVEMTADAATDFTGAMQALSTELKRSPHAREVVLHFGQPRNLMIYDRQNKSLTSLPGATSSVPCGGFIKGSFFNKVTDDIVHQVARNGDGLDGISHFCGTPTKKVENGCA